VTDIIDPPADSAPGDGFEPDRSGHATVTAAAPTDSFTDIESPEADASSSPLVPIAILVGIVAVVVHFFGFWGLFVIAGLIASIILHEFGHYLTAKQAGMKVTEFFVGFGPKIWSFTRGETTYGLKPLPLGAYVRIIGMNDLEEVEPGDEGRTYREKGYWARLRVVLAGPFMNFLIGFILLIVLYMSFAQPAKTGWTVDKAEPGSAAALVGLQKGDRLTSIDGHAVSDFDTFGKQIKVAAGHEVTLGVVRNGQTIQLSPTIGWILDGNGAAKLAPLMAGDRVTRVGDTNIATYDELRSALSQAPKGRAELYFTRGGYEYHTTTATPQSLPADGTQGLLGIRSKARMVHLGPVGAVNAAVHDFGTIVGGSATALTHFFSPSGLTNWTHTVLNSSSDTASTTGPTPTAIVAVHKSSPPADQALVATSASSSDNNRVLSIFGVLRLGSQAGAAGLATVVSLLALINIFLGLLNLVPLPPFDGGHAAVATYEAIREKISGRPYRADMAKLIPITYAVLVLMGFIFLSSSYLDLLHPAKNPFGP
jgi:RIP metalloprotease RseP